jgi:hypothetical protein
MDADPGRKCEPPEQVRDDHPARDSIRKCRSLEKSVERQQRHRIDQATLDRINARLGVEAHRVPTIGTDPPDCLHSEGIGGVTEMPWSRIDAATAVSVMAISSFASAYGDPRSPGRRATAGSPRR